MMSNFNDTVRNRCRLFGSASVMALACVAMPAFAQDSEPAEGEQQAAPPEENTILVTGFRASLANALAEKRRSDNIVDGINAEDIGKSADQNIADALQRVTGISIERSEGEGSTVTVRGIDANLNNVTLNGVTLTNAAGAQSLQQDGGEAGQAVDFSAFSSDLLQRVEVAKTASADQNEGSLGGAIRLTTFRPLGVRRDRRVFTIQARYSEFADENFNLGDDIFGGDYRVNLALSEKLFGNTLGVSLVATSEKTSGRIDSVNVNRYESANLIADPVTNQNFIDLNGGVVLPGGVLNSETGQVIFDGPTDAEVIRYLQPREVEYDQLFFETQRHNVTATVQWQPTDTTDIKIDATYSRTNRDRSRSNFSIRPFDRFRLLNGAPGPDAISEDGGGNVYDPITQSLTNYRLTTFPRPSGGSDRANNIGFVRTGRLIDINHEDTFALGFDIEQELGEFVINLSGGRSDSKFTPDEFASSSAQLLNSAAPGNLALPVFLASYTPGGDASRARPGLTKGFDCSPEICSIYFSDTVENRTADGFLDGVVNPELNIVDDPGEWIFGAISGRDVQIDDVSDTLFLDVDWERDFGPITSIEAGGKYERRQRVQQGQAETLSRFIFKDDLTGLSGRDRFVEDFLEYVITPVAVEGEALRDNFGQRLGLPRDGITDGIITYDPLVLRNIIQEQVPNAGRARPLLQNFRDVELDIWGGYLMANFEMMDGRLFGDFGVRYARTTVNASGGAVIEPSDSGFTIFSDNTAFFGFDPACESNPPTGNDCPNTATFEEAQARLVDLFGPDLAPGTVIEGSLATAKNTYDNWLPSFNLNWLAAEDLLVRFAASKTMARPNIDRLRPNGTIREATFGDSFGNAGNPFLLPFSSNNLDLSVEWYFDSNSLFSVALFNKDLKDAERNVSQLLYIRDPRGIIFDANGEFIPDAEISLNDFLLPYTPENQPIDICLPERSLNLAGTSTETPDTITRRCEAINFRRPINTGSGYVRGVEMSLQHNFTYLPGLLGGFGFVANYTYADSQIDEQVIDDGFGGEQVFREAPLPNTSNHTFNGTLFYEQGGLQLRAAYNWRSDYLLSSAADQSGLRTYVDSNDTLDLSGGYDISRNVSLNFQVVNVLDTKRREYSVVEFDAGRGGQVGYDINPEPLTLGNQPQDRFVSIRNSGRIFRVGLRFNF